MKRPSCITIILASLLFQAVADGDEKPEWIWGTTDRSNERSFHIRKSFPVDRKLLSAELRCVADFCDTEIRINGKTVNRLESYSQILTMDLNGKLKQGENEILLACSGVPGPSAVFAEIKLKFDEGPSMKIVTDSTWKYRDAQANGSGWVPVKNFGQVADEPWGVSTRQIGINAFDDYEQWKQALSSEQEAMPSTFQIAPEFEIELIRRAEKDEGSWVSMAFDPQGRIIIAREDAGLLRMTLSNDGSEIESVETINETLKECRGLLFAFDSLYVNANNSKGFYRLQDSNGDDQFDQVKLLRKFPGGVGHGRNDLSLGPDDKIYLIHGDSVEVPEDMTDLTSPLRERRLGDNISSGHVVRTDGDGKDWELVVAGMRNPFGIDFNADGQAFTYDADAEFDMGAPWYRATHVMHLAIGSDFGWRAVTGKWPPYFHDHPDNAPLTFEVGKGSPTAVKFGSRSNFPPTYQDALFILDWAYGRIVAVHMNQRGAGYACRGETFLKGRPLNVTDLDFSPDGAMYFVTGGRKTQAGLYRVRYVGEPIEKTAATEQQIARNQHASESRKILARLNESPGIDFIWKHLGSPDPTLRSASRIALERQPIENWQARAYEENDSRISLNAMMSLARNKDAEISRKVLQKLNGTDFRQLSTTWKLIGLHTYLLCLETEKVDAETGKKALENLVKLKPNQPSVVLKEISRLQVALSDPNTVSDLMPRLLSSSEQHDQLFYLYLLRNVSDGWTLDRRRAWFTILNQSRSYLGGQGLPGFLKKIREEAIATLSDVEAEALGAILKEPKDSIDAEIPERPLVKKWNLENAVSALELADQRGHRGDIKRGKKIFHAARCAQCHRVGMVGNLVGPDLTAASSRYSRRDLMEAIISPSKVIAPVYASVIVETVDGRTHEGRVVPGGDYRATKLKLATDPYAPSKVIEILKRDIVEQTPSETSWMPEGLLNSFDAKEIADLIAFIEAGQPALQQQQDSPQQ